jgi:hypothetical protein
LNVYMRTKGAKSFAVCVGWEGGQRRRDGAKELKREQEREQKIGREEVRDGGGGERKIDRDRKRERERERERERKRWREGGREGGREAEIDWGRGERTWHVPGCGVCPHQR